MYRKIHSKKNRGSPQYELVTFERSFPKHPWIACENDEVAH